VKVLNVHNNHAFPGGMEVLFGGIAKVLRDRGHDVIDLARNNSELNSLWSKLNAFGGAIYSPSTYRDVAALLKQQNPRVAHVWNLYPQFSTSALDAMYDAGVPVLMHVQDFKLTCPTAQHLRHGTICEKCIGGREYYAAIHNCRNSRAMSTSYALRNIWARVSGRLQRAVSMYVCPTKFVADLIIRGGYPADRVRVVPNFCDLPDVPPREHAGAYIGYIGRISPEKGVDVLIEAARRTGLPTKIAGDPHLMTHLVDSAPPNVQFVGGLKREQIPAFLDGVRALVVPSVWYEAFGIVCVEALSRGIPVIAADAGGLSEVIQHNETGLLVPMADAAALGEAMQRLWDDVDLTMRLGRRGYDVARQRFTPDAFYREITAIWSEVMTPAPETLSGSAVAQTETTRQGIAS